MKSAEVRGRVRVGVAGWSYLDWEGMVYPRPKPKGFDPLSYLAEYVDAIEINSTFYRPGPAKHALSWARRVETRPDFRFTVKLWQRLTHEGPAPDAAERREARVVPEVLAGAGRLGAVLAQFPWSFRNTAENRKRIAALAEWFRDLGLAVEVRHGSWGRPEVGEFFRGHEVAWVNIDQPVIGDSLGPAAEVTGGVGYVRLHGRNRADWFREDAGRDDRYNYLYSREELLPWRDRIEAMAGTGREVYVIANNHYKGQAMVNALEMRALIGPGAVWPAALWPVPLASAYPGRGTE